uniref:VWFA domain-containing protein n=1 Tax=Pavo cristatus TaxID=9049 RepID=A0A8C9FHY3_PAVCR
LLTDGEPTAGVTDVPRILSNARRALSPSAALLFGLAFGADADFALLRRLAAASGGTAQHIPEDADAALHLTDVFREIDSPLLRDVELTYPGTAAQRITPKLFPGYFQGSELVVAGRLEPGTERLRIRASGRGDEGELHADTEVVANATELPPGCPRRPAALLGAFVRRLWAFVTIQELLRAQLAANSTAARRRLAAEATELSLRYHFVTPFTSLVVVTPGDGGLTSPPSITTSSPTGTPDVTGTPDGAVGTPYPLCFTLDGRPGDILQLLTDPSLGEDTRVTPTNLGEGPPVSLPFSHPTQLHLPPVTLVLGPGGRLHLQWGPRLELLVLRHRYSRPGALQRDHLGFYVTNSSGLSPRAGGLLGECCPHPHGVALSPAQRGDRRPLSLRPPAGHPAVATGATRNGVAVPG